MSFSFKYGLRATQDGISRVTTLWQERLVTDAILDVADRARRSWPSFLEVAELPAAQGQPSLFWEAWSAREDQTVLYAADLHQNGPRATLLAMGVGKLAGKALHGRPSGALGRLNRELQDRFQGDLKLGLSMLSVGHDSLNVRLGCVGGAVPWFYSRCQRRARALDSMTHQKLGNKESYRDVTLDLGPGDLLVLPVLGWEHDSGLNFSSLLERVARAPDGRLAEALLAERRVSPTLGGLVALRAAW